MSDCLACKHSYVEDIFEELVCSKTGYIVTATLDIYDCRPMWLSDDNECEWYEEEENGR